MEQRLLESKKRDARWKNHPSENCAFLCVSSSYPGSGRSEGKIWKKITTQRTHVSRQRARGENAEMTWHQKEEKLILVTLRYCFLEKAFQNTEHLLLEHPVSLKFGVTTRPHWGHHHLFLIWPFEHKMMSATAYHTTFLPRCVICSLLDICLSYRIAFEYWKSIFGFMETLTSRAQKTQFMS